jgi:hypothetical protein
MASSGPASDFVMLLPAQAHDAKQNYGDVAFATALTMVKILDISCHIVTMPESPAPKVLFTKAGFWVYSKRPDLIGIFLEWDSPTMGVMACADTAPDQRSSSACASGQRAPPSSSARPSDTPSAPKAAARTSKAATMVFQGMIKAP